VKKITLTGRLILVFSCLGAIFNIQLAGQDDKVTEWKKWIKKYPPSAQAKELSLLFSIPSSNLKNDENYLWSPRQFLFDDNGDVFILDNKLKRLFKINSKGDFIKKGGREGQGPGEFQNPICFCMNDKAVFVSDTFKFEILIFDKDLVFKRSLKTTKSYLTIAISKNGLLIATPFRMTRESPLVDVIDESGKLLYSFADGLYGNKTSWNINNFVCIDINDRNEILLAYWHYPTVCKYDIKGNLLARYEIHNNYLDYAKKQNDDRFSDPNNRISFQAIWGIHSSAKGFFILLSVPYIRILEFDENGRQINDYWTTRSFDYLAVDFAVKGEVLYILSGAPNAQVDVYRSKESSSRLIAK
jgi:hypothetical protein